MKIPKIIILSSIFLFAYAANGWAFRCGSGLVSTGDSKTRVQVTCGKPTSKTKTCANSQASTATTKKGKIKKSKKCGTKTEVWHYNCGDGDFIYVLTFENGKMTKEDTEGRGKGKSDCQGK